MLHLIHSMHSMVRTRFDARRRLYLRAMNVTATELPDVCILEPRVHGDRRGFFLESWNQRVLDEALGQSLSFVQDNHSKSAAGVLRGIHYQLNPHPQGKLVRVTAGAVFDVAVDLRHSSSTFGEWIGVELSAVNYRQLWIPAGFGHAFIALTDGTEVLYKSTDYYVPEYDRTIAWNDPDIAIGWPLSVEPVLSDKDAAAPRLRDTEVFA